MCVCVCVSECVLAFLCLYAGAVIRGCCLFVHSKLRSLIICLRLKYFCSNWFLFTRYNKLGSVLVFTRNYLCHLY